MHNNKNKHVEKTLGISHIDYVGVIFDILEKDENEIQQEISHEKDSVNEEMEFYYKH